MSVLGAQTSAVANTSANRLLDNPFTISEFINLGANTFLERERIRAGQPINAGNGQGNNISDFPRVATGVNSDGSTLLAGRPVASSQLIASVNNQTLLIGAGLLVAAVAVIAAVS